MTARTSTEVHPGAWWLWGIGAAVAASRTTNPWLLSGLVGAVGLVSWGCATPGPVGNVWGFFLRLGAWIVGLRLVLQIAFGPRLGVGRVLFDVPSVALPDWMAGLSFGGPVTAESLMNGAMAALRLVTVLLCIGAVNTVCSPLRLLRTLPTVLYETGVVVSVALTATPAAVATARQVREARRLRGRSVSGVAALRGVAVPVLEGALDRSLTLASSLDARGFGRVSATPRTTRAQRVVAPLGLLIVVIGCFAVLSPSPSALAGTTAGGILLSTGTAVTVMGTMMRRRDDRRTRYRPIAWNARSVAIAVCAPVVVGSTVLAEALDPAVLTMSTLPWRVPLPNWPLIVGLAAVMLPLWIAPHTGTSQ